MPSLDDEIVGLYKCQIDLEVRSQMLFEKYMALPPPSTQPRGLMGKDKLAVLMRDVGVLQLEDNDKAAVLQELELSDVDEDCMLNFAEFVTFVRYLSARSTINEAILKIIHDEYQEARRRTVFRNYCDTETTMGRRGLTSFLKEVKLFKALSKFDRTMMWTASTETRRGSSEEYIPFRNFVSTTIPMIAAKVFANKKGPDGQTTTSTSEAIAQLWTVIDQEYVHICKHAERRNVLVQLMAHEMKLLLRAFVGTESIIDLAEVGRCLDQMEHTDRAPALRQLVDDIIEEECEPGTTEVLFTEFVSLVPKRFISPLKTGCIISLNAPLPPSLERSTMHPEDLEIVFRHFDVGKTGTIHFGQLEDMMTALQMRHKLKDLQTTLAAADKSVGNGNNQAVDIAELMTLVTQASKPSGESEARAVDSESRDGASAADSESRDSVSAADDNPKQAEESGESAADNPADDHEQVPAAE